MFNKESRSVWTLFVLVSLLAALPVFAESPRTGIQERELVPLGESVTYQRVITATYERLQTYIRPSGKDVNFELSDFDTLSPAQFEYVYWLDAVTMPDGLMLDVTRTVRQNDFTNTAGVYYQPSWQTGTAEWATSEDGRRVQTLKVSQALRELGAQDPQKGRAVALTTFNVTVSMEGQSRSYRAAFLWLPTADPAQRTFLVLDNITQGVEEAARESLPARSLAEDLAEIAEAPAQGPRVKAVCFNTTPSVTQQPYTATGTNNHFSGGYHRGTATFKVTCTCNSACASTCVAEIPSYSCTDSGTPSDMCHKMAQSANANTNRNDNDKVTPANCGAGFGCVKKSCLFCVCGLSVTVSVTGASVTFATSGDPDWSGNLQYSRSCAPCS